MIRQLRKFAPFWARRRVCGTGVAMGKVTVDVNGKPYVLGCADGEEARLLGFARQFDREVASLAKALGQIGDQRLFLMAGLLYAEELSDVRVRLKEAEFAQAAALSAQSADRDRIAFLEERVALLTRELDLARQERAAEAERATAAEEAGRARMRAAAAQIDALARTVDSI